MGDTSPRTLATAPSSSLNPSMDSHATAPLVPLLNLPSTPLLFSSAPEPKFLGFCCQPARTSCCGCTLQTSMKAIALLAMLLGALSLFGLVVSLGSTEPTASLFSIAKAGLVLAMGVALWISSESLKPKGARYSLWILVLTYTIEAVVVIIFVALAFAMRSTVSKEMFEAYERQFEEREHRPMTPAEANEGQHTVNTIISLFFAAMIGGIVIKLSIVLLIAYFIWSFIVRLERGELNVVAYGVHVLPLAYPQPYQAPPRPTYLVPTYNRATTTPQTVPTAPPPQTPHNTNTST